MDTTALTRQVRRIHRLADEGVQRSTVFVHRDCKAALDGLRPYFSDLSRAQELLRLLGQLDAAKAASLAQFGARRSPFRYPGGKSWLVRKFRRWLV